MRSPLFQEGGKKKKKKFLASSKVSFAHRFLDVSSSTRTRLELGSTYYMYVITTLPCANCHNRNKWSKETRWNGLYMLGPRFLSSKYDQETWSCWLLLLIWHDVLSSRCMMRRFARTSHFPSFLHHQRPVHPWVMRYVG